MAYDAKAQEFAYGFYARGYSKERAVREIRKAYPGFAGSTWDEWVERLDWKARRAEADLKLREFEELAQNAAAAILLQLDGIRQKLAAQIEKDGPNTQAVYAYTSVAKQITDLARTHLAGRDGKRVAMEVLKLAIDKLLVEFRGIDGLARLLEVNAAAIGQAGGAGGGAVRSGGVMPKRPKSTLAASDLGERVARTLKGARPEDRMTREQRVERGRGDWAWFCRYYLSHYFSSEPAEFHQELIQLAWSVDHFAGAAPREHAKSTVVGFARVIHAICYRLAHFVVIFREADNVAEIAVDDIRVEFEENERIREDFGDLIGGRKWAAGEFVTATDIKVMGRGRFSSARGLKHKQHRPDLVIVDDIEDDQLVESKEQRDKLDRWFRRVVSNIVGPGGKLFIIGTILHHDSLLSRLLKQTDVFTTRVWRAVLDNGKPLWPARWPLTRLEAKKKEIGARNFATEFMNDAANEEEQIFSPNLWKYFRDEDVAGTMDEAAAIDPAIGQKAKNDDTAVAVVAERAGNYYVLSCRLGKFKIQQQIELVFSTYRKFPRLLKFGFETVAYQSALKQLVDDRAKQENLQLPAVAVDDISTDKLKRLSTLAPLAEQGRIWWPSASSSYWHPEIERCKEEFESLGCSTNSHDDGPDAVERAIKLLRGRRGGKGKVALW